MNKTVQINYCRKVLCVTAYPCVLTSVPLTYVWAFGFVGFILFWSISKSGRVCASPKFRPNSVVELLGHEIHTCNVHQGWCQGSVLQFKTGESNLGADQPLAFSRNLKLWNLSGKLRKVQTPFKELHHWQTQNLWGLLGERKLYGLWHHTGKHNSIVMMSDVNTVLIWRSSTHALDFCVSKISQPRLFVRPFFTIPTPL